MPHCTLTDQVSDAGHICPESLQVSAVSSCLDISLHSFCCLHVLRIVHCGCCMVWDGCWLWHNISKEWRSELLHDKSLKLYIVHCWFLSRYLKYILKVVGRKHAISINILLSVLISCDLMLSLCVLIVNDFHYSRNCNCNLFAVHKSKFRIHSCGYRHRS
jgi:hypothetical protein